MPWLALLVFALLSSTPTLRAQAPLGATDGQDLSPYDLERIVAGKMAPDFRLQDQDGKVHQLSQYQGKNVVLVMYRGWW
jgi:hypothetical protein